jgi:serine/threonine protein kinase
VAHGDTERVCYYERQPSCKCAVAVSILIITLTIEQPNMMRVIEFRETPEPMIIMDYYDLGNIMEAGVAYDQYVTAVGQILDGLHHLHAKGVAHRDLKPENFLVEKVPFFKVVITDFGLSKFVTDTTLLRTFCGTLKYLAPEVFPGISDGYRPSMDIWALGVIAFEWLYGIPDPPTVPTPRKEKKVRLD